MRDVAEACRTGAATNIIYGLALGYKSVVIPILGIATTIFIAYEMASFYGIACAALGMLGTLSTCLTIDAYGPIADNAGAHPLCVSRRRCCAAADGAGCAGGIAEMSHMGEEVRERTDALDAAGNTTAAIGKGFAIGRRVNVLGCLPVRVLGCTSDADHVPASQRCAGLAGAVRQLRDAGAPAARV